MFHVQSGASKYYRRPFDRRPPPPTARFVRSPSGRPTIMASRRRYRSLPRSALVTLAERIVAQPAAGPIESRARSGRPAPIMFPSWQVSPFADFLAADWLANWPALSLSPALPLSPSPFNPQSIDLSSLARRSLAGSSSSRCEPICSERRLSSSFGRFRLLLAAASTPLEAASKQTNSRVVHISSSSSWSGAG